MKQSNLCINCNNPVSRGGNKYCSNNCQLDYQQKQRLEILLSGVNVTFDHRSLKSLLIKHYSHVCTSCGNKEWMEQPIPLENHHIDGDHKNNTFKNLALICPNCHALTDNYKSKNRSSTREYRAKYYKAGVAQ